MSNRIVMFTIAAAITLALTHTADAASFNDAANGNWNLGATWGNPGNNVEGSGYPGQLDDVTNNSHTVTLTATHACHNITISGGTLTAGTNTLKVTANWTLSSGTFNPDQGTVIFGIYAGTLNANGQVFYNLNINLDASQTLVISAGTTITVNGTLWLTSGQPTGGRIIAMGNVVQGTRFGGSCTIALQGSGAQSYTINGGNAPIIVFNNPNLDVTPSTNCGFNGLYLTAGTYRCSSYTTTIYSAFTINGGVFNADTGTVVLNGAGTPTLGMDGQVFNNVQVNTESSQSLNIGAGKSIVMNGTLTLLGGHLNGGTAKLSGDLNVSNAWKGSTTLYNICGSVTQTISGVYTSTFTTAMVTITNTGMARLGTNSAIDKTVIARGGTFDLAGCNFAATNYFTNNGTLRLQGDENVNLTPTFNPGSTVEYYGKAGQPVIVTNWPYKRLVLNAPGRQLNWTAGTTYTVAEAMVIPGIRRGPMITLRSTAPGTQWYINTTGATTDVNRVDVQDSVSTRPIRALRSLDSGRNTNWFFICDGTVVSVF